jgi:hypothetical protein
MKTLVRFTFWPDSVEGLKTYFEIYAHSYTEAKEKLLKCMYLGKMVTHLPRGEKANNWGTL